MSRLCSACIHPQRQQIDVDLVTHNAGYCTLARKWGITRDSLMRHEHHHLVMSWRQSKELAAMLSADNLLDRLAELDAETREMLTEARQAGDLRAALAAIRESRGNIESYARIGALGEVEARLAKLEAAQQEGGHDDPDFGRR